MINITEIEPNQFVQVAKLLKQLGYDVAPAELENRMTEIFHNKGNVFVGIDEEGNVVGCVHALIDTRLAGGRFGEIVSLVVDETLRGKGIGKKLIETAEKWFKSKGMNRLRVRCNTIRNEAHEFYGHLGFTEKKSQKIFEKPI
jgi:N-acetylglutamate synthase-like GNAT family acetyltransferase